MQATVHLFDQTTGTGELLSDSGELLSFGQEAFAAGDFRFLRSGQRVRVDVDPATGVPVALGLIGRDPAV